MLAVYFAKKKRDAIERMKKADQARDRIAPFLINDQLVAYCIDDAPFDNGKE